MSTRCSAVIKMFCARKIHKAIVIRITNHTASSLSVNPNEQPKIRRIWEQIKRWRWDARRYDENIWSSASFFFFLPPFIKYFTVDCLHNYGAVGWATEREKEFIRSYCCESFSFSPFPCYRSFSSLLSLIRHPHLKSHHTFKFEESCAPCECVKKRQWIYIRSGSCRRDSFSLSRREGRTKICTTISGLHHLYICCCSILRHVSLFAFIRRCEEEARNKEESSF